MSRGGGNGNLNIRSFMKTKKTPSVKGDHMILSKAPKPLPELTTGPCVEGFFCQLPFPRSRTNSETQL